MQEFLLKKGILKENCLKVFKKLTLIFLFNTVSFTGYDYD